MRLILDPTHQRPDDASFELAIFKSENIESSHPRAKFKCGLKKYTYVMANFRDSLNKREGQKLEQKSKSTQTPSYLPSDICRYCKKLGHWKFNCPVHKKKKEKKKRKNYMEIGG